MPVVRGKGIISKYCVSNKPPIIIKEALREKVVILNSVPKEIKKDVMGIRYTGTLNNQEDCMYIFKDAYYNPTIKYNHFLLSNSYLPTSGDLKSGDSLFCNYNRPPPPNVNSTNTPTPPAPRQQIALGHYMMSYMTYMGSKCAFIIVMTN